MNALDQKTGELQSGYPQLENQVLKLKTIELADGALPMLVAVALAAALAIKAVMERKSKYYFGDTKSLRPKKMADEPTQKFYNFDGVKIDGGLHDVFPRAASAMGDFNGDYFVMKEGAEHLKVARFDKAKPIWTGGDQTLILMNDTVADLGTEVETANGGYEYVQRSHLAMRTIRELSRQALKNGGEIIMLAANHENIAKSFLTSTKTASGHSVLYFQRKTDGMAEFYKYSSDPDIQKCRSVPQFTEVIYQKAGYNTNKLFKKMRRYLKNPRSYLEIDESLTFAARRDILLNMRKDSEGRALLEQMCDQQLAVLKNRILYCHTDPTKKMLRRIMKPGKSIEENVAEINQIYQKGIRAQLLEDKPTPQEFHELEEIFLHTGNRTSDKRYAEVLDELKMLPAHGCDYYVHGHTTVGPIGNPPVCGAPGSATVLGIDFGAGRYDQNRASSLMQQDKNGAIRTGLFV